MALLLRRPFPNIPSGTLLLFADMAVVLTATLIFKDIHVALYSAITIYFSSKVIDAIAQGVMPYGLAAHLLLGENNTMASFFNQRYSELMYTIGTKRTAVWEDIVV